MGSPRFDQQGDLVRQVAAPTHQVSTWTAPVRNGQLGPTPSSALLSLYKEGIATLGSASAPAPSHKCVVLKGPVSVWPTLRSFLLHLTGERRSWMFGGLWAPGFQVWGSVWHGWYRCLPGCLVPARGLPLVWGLGGSAARAQVLNLRVQSPLLGVLGPIPPNPSHSSTPLVSGLDMTQIVTGEL